MSCSCSVLGAETLPGEKHTPLHQTTPTEYTRSTRLYSHFNPFHQFSSEKLTKKKREKNPKMFQNMSKI